MLGIFHFSAFGNVDCTRIKYYYKQFSKKSIDHNK